METQNLQLTTIHYELLELVRERNPLTYYKANFNKQEQLAFSQLIDAGKLIKTLERYQINGAYRSRVFLSVKK